MKRITILILTLCLLTAFMTGCGTPSAQPGGDADVRFLTAETFRSDRVAGDVSASFRTAYADFAVRLLKASQDQNGRLISPLSVMTALQMVANGAKEETLRQFENLFGGKMDTKTLNQELFNYYQSLAKSAGPDARVEAANAVWMTNDENFKVAEEFIRVISNTFDAQLAQASFTDPKTVDAINDWCFKHTDGMIPKILNYGDVSENDDTLMVLLNAILFDALWSIPYEENRCYEGTFTTGQGVYKNVTMMYGEEHRYIKGDRETGFIKYYKGGYAFVALLPEKGMSLENYLTMLDGTRFTELLDGVQKRSVDTGLPKFSFDWSDSLKETLKDLGLTDCFDRSRSDLSGIGNYYDLRLYANNVIHKTHIEVDESGTRAAAVTAVVVDAVESAVQEDNPRVILNRPFVYAIVDTANMLPVFIGTVTNPA